ncbi:MAG: CoA ester lyase [Actinobacteria bacterium]|nr:CoA ester lyase [Actinomycetota bacterium]
MNETNKVVKVQKLNGYRPTLRSYLYVPADKPEKLERAAERGADAIIVDLEDAVAEGSKRAARHVAASWLESIRLNGFPEIWVRVNAARTSHFFADVEAVVAPTLSGICLPKSEEPEDLFRLHELLALAEEKAGLALEQIRVSALIETPYGLIGALKLAGGPRVDRLQIGEADLAAHLALQPADNEAELLPARFQVVLVSAASKLAPPVGPVSVDFSNLEALRSTTLGLRRLGFGGRAAIHPAQVPVINSVFTPSADEEADARSIVDRYRVAQNAGTGVIDDGTGKMIDEAVIRSALAVVERASLCRSIDDRRDS